MSFLSMLYRRRRTAASESEPTAEPQRQTAVVPETPAPLYSHASNPPVDSFISAQRIADLCIAASEPGAVAAFVRRRVTESEVLARLDEIADIRTCGRFMRKINPDISSELIDVAVDSGMSAPTARYVFQAAVVARQSPEINTALRADDRPRDHGWGRVIEQAKASKKS
jgi:hypothetical protein